MTSKDVEFWQTEGINYYRWPTGTEYYEGEDNVATVVEYVGNEFVRDLGCGYGRLAKNFDPAKYIGYDICQAAIQKATRLNPLHTFVHWNLTYVVPAPTTMFINGPHLVHDDEINHIMDLLCTDTAAVVLGELMARQYRSIPYTYGVYHREIEEYDSMFATRGFVRTRARVGHHPRLNAPYTAAKWERK